MQAVLVQLTNPDSSTTDFPAELVGTDPQHDIAVLRIRAEGRQLRGLPLGTAYDLRVGQALYAIGNPLGSNPQTLTAGERMSGRQKWHDGQEQKIEHAGQTACWHWQPA